MKKVMSHVDFTRVGHCQSILEAQGIKTHVKNLHSSIGMGEIPFIEVWPELWVVRDEDLHEAQQILAELKEALHEKTPPWLCPNCGETVDQGFGECWNCGTEMPQGKQ